MSVFQTLQPTDIYLYKRHLAQNMLKQYEAFMENRAQLKLLLVRSLGEVTYFPFPFHIA